MRNASDWAVKVGVTFVVVLVVALIAGFIGLKCVGCSSKAVAEKRARTWAKELMPDTWNGRVSCMSRDTDGDGYVSCAVGVKNSSDAIPIECGARFTLNDGCKRKIGVVQVK